MQPTVLILENIHDEGVEELQRCFSVTEACGLSESERIEMAKKFDVVIVKSVTKVNKLFIDSCPHLKVIARAGTGLDNIDCEYAQLKKIPVLSVPTGNTKSAADFTLLLILASIRRLKEVLAKVESSDFRRHLLEGRELSEMKVGLIGLGNVGIEVAKRLHGFGCLLHGFDPNSKHKDVFAKMGGINFSNLKDMLKDIDILSLHCSLTEQNHNFINKQFIENLDKPIFLINTARGKLVDEEAVLEALNQKKLLFYSSDLLSIEPPFDLAPSEHDFKNPLIGHLKTIITPHVAASTIDAQKRIAIDLAKSIINLF